MLYNLFKKIVKRFFSSEFDIKEQEPFSCCLWKKGKFTLA